MRRREMKRKRLVFSSPLFETVREVDEYNRNNATDYSYGQYVTLIKPHLKRGRKKKKKKKRNIFHFIYCKMKKYAD